VGIKKKDQEKSRKNNKNLVTALVADRKGRIFELDGYAAVGMAGSSLVPLRVDNTINMPYGGELMFLPDRKPVAYNIEKNEFETLRENPYVSGEPLFPVAAFNSPGYVISYVSAYKEDNGAGYLPLFSYGAVGWLNGKYRSSIVQVDKERRQDLRLMKQKDVIYGINKMRKKMPSNRLREHLEKCALQYGCPAGKNFFLGRYEAPLPTSGYCNASCLGCISLQTTGEIPNSQDRISFTPSPEEIAEVALEHIKKVKRSVVSFGQGCEGDPLMKAEVVEPAIRIIRSATSGGTINMNTNASRPDVLEKLFAAGLDSVRISINSIRSECYDAYFRPNGYTFSDVKKSFDIAIRHEKFVAINYLNCPGFTDTLEEVRALIDFIKEHPLNMIQWRNLNYDPLKYLKLMNKIVNPGEPLGIKNVLSQIRQYFPNLKCGYFNPPKEKF